MSLRGGSGSACLRRWARDGRASHACRSDFSSCRRARPKSRAAARWGLLSTHARTPPSVGTWLDYVAQVSRSQQFARARSRSMRANATADGRCRRSARGPAALRQPPSVAARIGDAARRLPGPLGLRGWRLSERQGNRRWLEVTRPIVEAFFHAQYFLEMAVRYGRQLKRPPRQLPSGWAAFLYLYDLR